MFPKKSAFGQEDDRKLERGRAEFEDPLLRPEIKDQPIPGRTANVESWWSEIDQACSMLDGGGYPVPAGNISRVLDILERVRDDMYSNLR